NNERMAPTVAIFFRGVAAGGRAPVRTLAMSLEPTPAGQPPLQVPHPIVQLARLLTAGSAAFRTTAPEGYQRGIDIYSAAVLPMILAKSARQFRAAHGRFPDLIEPIRYTGKIYC